MAKFFKKQEIIKDTINLFLTGFINEEADFGVTNLRDVKSLNVDFNKVTLINSTGVLIWITWTKEILEKNPHIGLTLSSCPKVIIDQINNVKGFLPLGAIVISFYLPYHCEACGKNFSTMVSLGKEYTLGTNEVPGKLQLPERPCPDCKGELEEDFIRAQYLKFLKDLCEKK